MNAGAFKLLLEAQWTLYKPYSATIVYPVRRAVVIECLKAACCLRQVLSRRLNRVPHVPF